MIIVSDKAKARILELRKKKAEPKMKIFRVSVKGGGCSGLMYDLGFDGAQSTTDHVFEE